MCDGQVDAVHGKLRHLSDFIIELPHFKIARALAEIANQTCVHTTPRGHVGRVLKILNLTSAVYALAFVTRSSSTLVQPYAGPFAVSHKYAVTVWPIIINRFRFIDIVHGHLPGYLSVDLSAYKSVCMCVG